jgi:PAS domain S-box-containing protein
VHRILDGQREQSPWRQFGAALLFVLLACPISVAMDRWFGTPPLVPFYGAVALAVWYGGIAPALTATALSVIAYGFIVVGSFGQWSLHAGDTPRIVAFVLFSVLLSVLSVSRDRAEAALHDSERRFRAMLETANEGVWLVDRDARTQYANDRMAALLGAAPERVAAAGVLDFVFPEDMVAARERLAANLAGRAEVYDFRFRCMDGEEVLVLAGTSPVHDDGGRVVGALGLFTDVTDRRRAEAALSRANERFALAADAVQSLIYEWDAATGKVEWNAGLFPLIGYRPEEARGDLDWWHERIHAADRAPVVSQPWRQQADASRYSHEYRVRHRAGHWVSVWDQGRIVRDEHGAIVRVIGSVIDITGRTEAERALRLLDEAGRVLASSLDFEETLQRVAWFAVPTIADWCVVDLIDETGSTRRVAVAHADAGQADLAAKLMQYPPLSSIDGIEARVIRTATGALLEDVRDEHLEVAAQNAEHLEVLRALRLISAIVMPLQVGGGVHGAMSFATTTTSNRRFDKDDFALAEQLARRSAVAIQNAELFRDAQAAEDRYRGLFEGTKDGIIVFDPSGICIDVNSALLGMIGYGRDELVGQVVSLIAVGGPWWGEERAQLRQEGQWRGEFELRSKQGAPLPVESSITRVSLPTGPAYVGVVRDMSERRRFDRLQEEFVSALAHDLKNPLTTVRGQTQLLRRRLDRGEPPEVTRLDSALEGIDAAAVRMTRLLDELADVMRLRAGQGIDLNREPTDLVALVRRSIDEQQRTTERHQVRLLADMDELTGFWDGPRLERVLSNLLGNAIKYSPQGGEITVRVGREGDGGAATAVLSVADRGVGIPAQDLTLIFERFRRAGNVESFAGSGIGLAGAKRIIALHGGTIAVSSTEGEGSTFTVRLPIASGDD